MNDGVNKTFRSLYDGEQAPGGEQQQQQSPLGGAQNQQQSSSGTPPTLPQGAVWADHRFIEGLPEDIRNDPTITKHSKGGAEALARAHVHATRLIGKDPARLLELPDGTPDLKAITTVAQRLGLPADVKAYKLEAPQGSPAWLAPVTPFAQAMIGSAHKHGILPAQFQGWFNDVAPLLAQAEKDQQATTAKEAAEGLAAIKAQQGQALDGYLARANAAVEKLGGEELRTLLIKKGLDTNPLFMNVLAKIGEQYVEDNGGEGSGGSGGSFGSALPPAEAKARGNDLLRQAMNEKNPVEKKRLNIEAQKFFAMASPKKA